MSGTTQEKPQSPQSGPQAATKSATGQLPTTLPAPHNGPIVFFDGVCGLCSNVVDFTLKRDRKAVFRFAPLQGETARALLTPEDVENLNTFVVRDEQGLHRRSTAVVRMLWRLGGLWRAVAALLWIVPLPLRNFGYRTVARYRYSWFGKKETCRMPTADERERILA